MLSDKDKELEQLERETEELRKRTKENDSMQLKKETEVLMTALTAMQGKNTHLENSLSSETRLKLDLFSALGDTRRQLEITQNKLSSKERDVETLKAKIAEVMAVMPATSYPGDSPGGRFSANHLHSQSAHDLSSALDPSAPCYIPSNKQNGLL
ncbi:predicted protein [Nematostella vectensis]|uniref:Macoilin n=2 Tax=Nematostella vectensis TaxID=45351 RepID=A7S5C6_NEMVE|nr:predicted protein [Nematostella vectensis]|eukprot:XP_001633158.1 predicted protein [Nematostella vectensis]